MLKKLILMLIFSAISSAAIAESVYVKYRGNLDLKTFQCEWVTKSSMVNRLCYDPKEQYAIVNLKGTYYHYCEIPSNIISDWRKASSMGSYFNSVVKGNFDCRVFRVPNY
jgi:hypothetical protein